MPASIKRRIRRYAIYTLFAAPLLGAFHYANTVDQQGLCDSGEMYGEECY